MDYSDDPRVVAAEARHARRRRRAGAVYGIVTQIFFISILVLAVLVIGTFARIVLPHIFRPTPAEGQVVGELSPAGEGLPLFRLPGSVAVMAQATARWEQVPTEALDLLGPFRLLPPYATQNTRGQVFELLEGEAGWTPSDRDGRFVVVPWTLGCGCGEEGWDQADWVPAGDTVTFLLSRTRERMHSSWRGPPVYDALGWHQPYPTGELITYWRTTREEHPDWLEAREFFELLQLLPWEHTFHLSPSDSFQPILAWVDGSPERRGAFPVSTILSEWEKRARH